MIAFANPTTFMEEDEPCDCLLTDVEIKVTLTLLGSPVSLPYYEDVNYEKLERLKLAVITEEGVMRGSKWHEFAKGVKKYLTPRCPSCK